MQLSKIALSIGSSATLKLNEMANTMKKQGKQVIHLGGGEPEFDIPEMALNYSIEKLNTKRIKYTATTGLSELKEEIARYTKKCYGISISNANIVISSGAKQSIYNFLMSVLNPGDEVIFPAPYWVSYPEMVKMLYANPVIAKPENGLLCSIEDINKKITSNTKAIMLNTPNNPSGLIYGEDFIKEIVGICEEKNIFLLMDDIYNKLVFDNVKIPSAFEFSNRDMENSLIVSINGVSKTFSMTGFRIGWSISSKNLALAMGKIQAQITSCPSELSQIAALGALREGDIFTQKMVKELKEKRDILYEEIKKIKKVKIEKPQGTFYSFPDFSLYEKDSRKLSEKLINEIGVVTVPGIEFGIEGHLRISYCGKREDIIKGVNKIREYLDK
jgi:aspartate aminotransferase